MSCRDISEPVNHGHPSQSENWQEINEVLDVTNVYMGRFVPQKESHQRERPAGDSRRVTHPLASLHPSSKSAGVRCDGPTQAERIECGLDALVPPIAICDEQSVNIHPLKSVEYLNVPAFLPQQRNIPKQHEHTSLSNSLMIACMQISACDHDMLRKRSL